MDSLSLPEVTPNLDNLINQITETHQPIMIQGTQNKAIMISKDCCSNLAQFLLQ